MRIPPISLKPSTTYWMDIRANPRGGTTNTITPHQTTSLDQTGLPGWDLGHHVYVYTGPFSASRIHSGPTRINGSLRVTLHGKTVLHDPSIVDVAIDAPSTTVDHYVTGDVIKFQVEFNEPMVVTGAPTFQFELGDETIQAAWVGGATNNVVVFSYTVQATDEDLDGISWEADAVNLNDGTIKAPNAPDNQVDLSHDPRSPFLGYQVGAVSEDVLYSNFAHIRESGVSGYRHMTGRDATQQFYTGGNQTGYALAGLELDMSLGNGQLPPAEPFQ